MHRGVPRRNDYVDRRPRPSLVTAARTFQAVDMFVPLITISLLGLILNGLLQGAAILFAARVSGSLMQRLKWR